MTSFIAVFWKRIYTAVCIRNCSSLSPAPWWRMYKQTINFTLDIPLCFIYRVIKKDGLNWIINVASTQASWLRYSKFSARSTGWLAWVTLKTLLNSSHVLLWYTWSAGAFAFTQTAYLLKLMIPTTNALPRWRLNVETKTKRTLHSSRRLSFNELTNAKNLVLHSSRFALNWRCCTAVLCRSFTYHV